jgi:hypothetical protein
MAIATFAATDRGEFHGTSRTSSINWRTPMVRSAASAAMADIYGRAVQCLRADPELAAAAATALPTQLRVFVSSGEITRAVVTASSGNDVLDKAVIACYAAVPKDKARAKYLADTRDADIVLPWRTVYARQPSR